MGLKGWIGLVPLFFDFCFLFYVFANLEKHVSENMRMWNVKTVAVKFGNAPFDILDVAGTSKSTESASLVIIVVLVMTCLKMKMTRK